MAVDNAIEIIPVINKLRKMKHIFDYIFLARDWHPPNHISFQKNNPNTHLFEQVSDPETGDEMIMWPSHCIQGSRGAQFHKDLDTESSDILISKGVSHKVDAFSAFGSDREDTGLYTELKKLQVTHLYCVGLALDFCVGYTAQDAAEEGFAVTIISEAVKSVNPEESSRTYE